MSDLVPHIDQLIQKDLEDFAHTFNNLTQYVACLKALGIPFKKSMTPLQVHVTAGKHAGSTLPVSKVLLDANGITVWATIDGAPQRIQKVVGNLLTPVGENDGQA